MLWQLYIYFEWAQRYIYMLIFVGHFIVFMVLIANNESNMSQKNEKFNLFLYFSALAANLASFSIGTIYCWSSPAIPKMNGQIISEDNPLTYNITAYEESWIASLVPLGSSISAFISGYLSDRIGRKNTLFVFNITVVVGFACLCAGSEIMYFYIGRFLCGLGCGAAFTIVPVYVGEIAQSSNRGTLGCFFTFGMSIGGIFTFSMCPYISLKVLSGLCLIPPLVFLMVFAFMPESPYYYVAKGKIEMAEKVLLKLRLNSKETVDKELLAIVKNVEESFENRVSLKSMCTDKTITTAFGISMGLLCFQQWSGINIVFFYMQSIFEETGSTISSDNCVLIGGILQLVASICTLFTVDRFGIRVLLIASATGNVLTLLITGIYFYLRDDANIYVDNINWLPVTTINLFILTYTLGIGPISFAMIGELFPPNVKSLAATMNVFVYLLCAFCVTNIFPYLKESIGLGLSFLVLGLISCGSCIFVYMKVPETKGKNIEEIQDVLRMYSKNNK